MNNKWIQRGGVKEVKGVSHKYLSGLCGDLSKAIKDRAGSNQNELYILNLNFVECALMTNSSKNVQGGGVSRARGEWSEGAARQNVYNAAKSMSAARLYLADTNQKAGRN